MTQSSCPKSQGWSFLPGQSHLNTMECGVPLQRSAVSRLCPSQGHFYQEWHRLPPRSWGKGKTSLSAKTKFFISKMLHFLLMNDVIGCLQGGAKWEASEPSWRHWPVSGAGDQTQLLFESVFFLARYVLVMFQWLTDIRDAEKLGLQSLVCFKTPMPWGLTDDISGSKWLALTRSRFTRFTDP